ncbi:MAG TPA: HAMP domain-containing sensor histidine kinase, partial [Alphaproteobacteria bacterium]
ANAPVTVRMEGGADRMLIRIHNEGEPIPEKDIDNIFNSFVQGQHEDDGQEHSKSLGLGLFISKEIILAHGGTIKVCSKTGEGTTFVACIPRKEK